MILSFWFGMTPGLQQFDNQIISTAESHSLKKMDMLV